RSVGLHFRVAARLLGWTRIDCRRVDRRLLALAAAGAAARGSLPSRRRLPWLELASDRRDGARLRARLGWFRRARAEAAVRLRVVRRLLRLRRRLPRQCAAQKPLDRAILRIMKSKTFVGALLVAVAAAASLSADEGMWRIDHLPLDLIASKYGVRLTPADLEKLQYAPVRLIAGESAGTGTFASAN